MQDLSRELQHFNYRNTTEQPNQQATHHYSRAANTQHSLTRAEQKHSSSRTQTSHPASLNIRDTATEANRCPASLNRTEAQQNKNSSTANSGAAGQPEHTTTHQPAEQPPAQDSLNRSKTNHPASLNRAETQPQKQNNHNHQSRNTATTIRVETQR